MVAPCSTDPLASRGHQCPLGWTHWPEYCGGGHYHIICDASLDKLKISKNDWENLQVMDELICSVHKAAVSRQSSLLN
ncbi:hypothetical protein PoB_003823800 [Plakobranchus ocellatus]|uniref:SRCR domain-containing protein n=1 Tax=Plakobranchus ocellatus TaxID=259542 RepID=A0AAV4AXZ9_9GAST|nr:hypothetical protein PoB_003823800 [Plakobranchus ocellatus]